VVGFCALLSVAYIFLTHFLGFVIRVFIFILSVTITYNTNIATKYRYRKMAHVIDTAFSEAQKEGRALTHVTFYGASLFMYKASTGLWVLL
jgi:hypothetical protein